MIAERKPLSALDPNNTRVQPTRAAKTGHKWLGQHRTKTLPNDNLIPGVSYPLLECCAETTVTTSGKENNDPTRKVCYNGFPREHCDNYEHLARDAFHRVPLRDINLNQLNARNQEEAKLQEASESIRICSSLCDSQSSSDSMDTGSDSSFRSVLESDVCGSTDESQLVCSMAPVSKPRNDLKTKLREKHRTQLVCDILDDYFLDILRFMKSAELKYAPHSDYLSKQKEITSSMRVKLVDWLIEVQDEYKLQNETLHLAVSYVDRFLSSMSVTRAKLQLLGTTAMFLAAKFEEIYPPDADEFAYVTADTYSRSEVLLMERLILRVFDCTLSTPTTYQYITLLCQKCNLNEKTCFLAEYFSDIMLLEETFLKYPPSVRAAASITLALCTIRRNDQPKVENLNEVIRQTDCSRTSLPVAVRENMAENPKEVYNCTLDLAESHWRASINRRFVYEKHSSATCKFVAHLSPVHSPNQQTTAEASLSWLNLMSVWTK